MAEHRVLLVELIDPLADVLEGDVRSLGKSALTDLIVRNELVERGVDEANRDGQAIHDGRGGRQGLR